MKHKIALRTCMMIALLALMFALGMGCASAKVSVPITVTIEGHNYTLPCTLSEFFDQGWQCWTNSNNLVDALAQGWGYLRLPPADGRELELHVNIKNEHNEARPYGDCLVTYVGISENT